MSIRLMTIAVIAAAAAMHPATSRAAGADPALTACAKQFAADLSVYTKSHAGEYSISFLNRGHVDTESQYDAGIYTYDLAAREPQSGALVASARCSVDEHGSVIASSVVPSRVVSPTLAAD